MGSFAHYDLTTPEGEPLVEHLRLVAARAAEFAHAFSASGEARVAGLLHDLGKYGDAFQRRLRGELRGVDHWSAGAWHALQLYQRNGVAIALVIQGHHIGLQEANRDSLRRIDPNKLQNEHPLGLTVSYGAPEHLANDGVNVPFRKRVASIYHWGTTNASSMLDVRMLFSTLVDADFLETEAWFNRDQHGNRRYRPSGSELIPELALSALKKHALRLAKISKASPGMRQLRQTLFSACLVAGTRPQGLFTLTAPTGSGKTLAMLAFALAHCAQHKLRRIVVVVPYLTVIEQTAAAYREVFRELVSEAEMERYLLEDHSLSPARVDARKGSDADDAARLLSENWDAPVVVTTNVQFLESLFSNSPSTCRKLHRLARSVVLFDEVQTLPLSLVIPTLGVLSRLVERYGVSVVFATATQPAFKHLNEQVAKHCSMGWQPYEIVPDVPRLFGMVKRNEVVLPKRDELEKWDDLAQRIADERQVLCIVNVKKHAKLLFEKVKAKRFAGVFHLSTNMCPVHRKRTLDSVRSLLEEDKPCCLISTQCVEAGVDIDFPVVFRSLGPLDAIAQAAGRCNRNARWNTCSVNVFSPEDQNYPDSAYKQATDVATSLLSGRGSGELDTADLQLFERYYRELYSLRGVDRLDHTDDRLLNAIVRQDFAEVNRLYRVIPQDAINVLVPFDKEEYYRLAQEVRENGLNYEWIRKARPHCVSLFRPRSHEDRLYLCLEPIRIKPDKPEESEEWYIYRKEEDYDVETGLNLSFDSDVIIA
jgi:CRISPR-associated helicase Cas3/CRISPR-associated endonuclease Cas3-HD